MQYTRFTRGGFEPIDREWLAEAKDAIKRRNEGNGLGHDASVGVCQERPLPQNIEEAPGKEQSLGRLVAVT